MYGSSIPASRHPSATDQSRRPHGSLRARLPQNRSDPAAVTEVPQSQAYELHQQQPAQLGTAHGRRELRAVQLGSRLTDGAISSPATGIRTRALGAAGRPLPPGLPRVPRSAAARLQRAAASARTSKAPNRGSALSAPASATTMPPASATPAHIHPTAHGSASSWGTGMGSGSSTSAAVRDAWRPRARHRAVQGKRGRSRQARGLVGASSPVRLAAPRGPTAVAVRGGLAGQQHGMRPRNARANGKDGTQTATAMRLALAALSARRACASPPWPAALARGTGMHMRIIYLYNLSRNIIMTALRSGAHPGLPASPPACPTAHRPPRAAW